MHLLCSGSQRTRLRDRDERTDIVEIEVIHRQRFLFPAAPRRQWNNPARFRSLPGTATRS
jgi:hypothetical protein